MKHTFILEPGTWNATGYYSDENGNRIDVTAVTICNHTDKEWINEGVMNLELSKGNIVEIRNTYKINPFTSTQEYTMWTSENPALGELGGLFIIVKDTILSSYRTGDGEYHGTECLHMLDENTYHNRGALFKGDNKVSSWAVTLLRE